MSFKLDTSGVVDSVSRDPEDFYRWSDLSPFAQGYVEALFRERTLQAAPDSGLCALGFSDLAPETLQQILVDCARRVSELDGARLDDPHNVGSRFWQARHLGARPEFPPLTLTLYLDDNGKVRFR